MNSVAPSSPSFDPLTFLMHTFTPCRLVLPLLGFLSAGLSAAPIAGSDFSNSATFNQPGGSLSNTTDDLDVADGVTVSGWGTGGGGAFIGNLDANAQVGMPNDTVTKINGDAESIPSVGSPPSGSLASVSFSITIPADTTVDLTSVTWDWRKATGSGNARWLAFRTSLDATIIFSEFGLARNAVTNETITLADPKYKGLSGQTVTFYWYAGGEGSGDTDIDTIIVNGDVNENASTLPTVVNLAPSSITPTSATLGGEVTDTGGGGTNATLYWGDNDGGTNPAGWDNAIPFGKQSGPFSSGISGLSPSTTYYFRSLASNSVGDDWADSTATFSTGAPPDPPVVSNSSATDVTFTTAEIHGSVVDTGGETPNVVIYYGGSDGGTTPENWDDSVSIGAQSGAFESSLFSLTHNTTYYYRAFAENSGGSAWSPASSNFTTQAYSLPAVVNLPAGNLTGTAAQIGGEVTQTGGDAPTITIYYGDNDGGTAPGSWDNSLVLGIQNATFSDSITGLSPLTTYYFRSSAQNAAGVSWAPASEQLTTLDVSELIITEFMASNGGGQSNNPNGWYPISNQVPGTTDDWIEIHNTGGGALDLEGWHLTDDQAELGKWTFPPATTLASGAFLIVYASGNNAPDANGNLHTNFRLSKGGEYLALVRPSGSVANEFGPAGSDFPGQDDDISYGLHPASSQSVFFASPTPGAANDVEGLARVSDTKFSPDRGYYQAALDVTLTTETENAVIYYTTDGNLPIDASGNPTATALVYTAPIAVTRTSAIRAAATKSGFAPTNVDAHTYILLDIDNANPDGSDPAGLNAAFLQQTQPAGWGSLSSGDYNMDPNVSEETDAASGHASSTAQTLLKGMRDIPTISISMNRDDFSGSGGIYTNSQSDLIKACSAELIPAANGVRSDWQINCGIKVQGGASRNPSSSPKHSLNFRFRAEYGPGRLREALFPGSAVEEFNSITLRAGYNNSWIHRTEDQRNRGSLIRDQWMRESMLDMGNSAAGEGFMTHVFINGLYWGVHNLCERPEASHYAAHNGGDEDLLDATNAGSFIDGNSTAWNQINGVVSSGDWSKIQQVIDIGNYIDYQIVNRYGGNADLRTGNNWRAAGGGPFPTGQPELMAPWQLYSWDGERSLESQTSTLSPVDPMGVRGLLEGNAEYRMLFADHLQRHFFHQGALTPGATEARWEKFASDLDRAIIAESARWGDHRGTLYTRDNQWLGEQSRLYNSYFPVRTSNVLNQYQNEGFFPDTAAPVFLVNGSPQYGGEIPSGGTLTLTATSGTIYYTTDGSDPRLEGGGVNGSAIAISSGSTVTLSNSGLIRTRALDGGEWSALDEATFYVEQLARPGDLVISEIHYNPYRATPSEKAAGYGDADEFEFIELLNVSPDDLNLDGVTFDNGITFTFGISVIGAGDYLVLAKNPAALALRYPGVTIAGAYQGSLGDDGETIGFSSPTGATFQEFTYDNSGSWPNRPDGNGSSLEVLNVLASYGDPENWISSCEFNGSPGVAGSVSDGRVVINEVLTNVDSPATDLIEIYNASAGPIDISGWVLSDDNDSYPSFQIPDDTTIASGAYLTFDASEFNPAPSEVVDSYSGTIAAAPTTVTDSNHGLVTGDTITIEGYGGTSDYDGTWEVTVIDASSFTIDTPFLDNDPTRGKWIQGRPFGLSASNGESLWLLETDSLGRPLKFVDKVEFAAAFKGESLGRFPDGAGNGTLVSMEPNTFGSQNSDAQIGPVVISEVMYFPSGASEETLEFIEICNAGTTTENLANWRLRGGADFDFTANHTLAPGAVLVIVAFDPVTNSTAADNFRTNYGIDAEIPLVGPFVDGPLGNVSGTVRLQRPDTPSPGDPTFYPQVTEDEVRYLATAPWPDAADNGASLNREGSQLFGNFDTSWSALAPTPGGKRNSYDSWQESWFGSGSPANSGFDEDFSRDGVTNGIAFALGLNPLEQNHSRMPGFTIREGNAVLTYERDLLLSGLTYRAEYSVDLQSWHAASESVVSEDNYRETVEASVPISLESNLFMRLIVVQE